MERNSQPGRSVTVGLPASRLRRVLACCKRPLAEARCNTHTFHSAGLGDSCALPNISWCLSTARSGGQTDLARPELLSHPDQAPGLNQFCQGRFLDDVTVSNDESLD